MDFQLLYCAGELRTTTFCRYAFCKLLFDQKPVNIPVHKKSNRENGENMSEVIDINARSSCREFEVSSKDTKTTSVLVPLMVTLNTFRTLF